LCLKARGPEGGPSGSDPDPNPNAPPTPKSQEPIPIPEELEKKVLDQTLKDY
jgi:hypothetical protein